jgi:diguanylate cyclase (GGDEF)-like protein
MLLKTSFVCLLLLSYMGAFYFANKHLPIRATKIFTYYYLSAVTVTVFDLITLYTVNHMDTVPAAVNEIAHIIYMLAINLTVYLNFLYLRGLLEGQIPISRAKRLAQAVPSALTSILILVLPLDYRHGAYTNYSMGAKVYALYVCVLLLNIGILYYCIRYWKLLSREKRAAIVASVPIFLGVSILNILFPESLLVIVYVVLTAVGLMMSNENCEKYIDPQTAMFNQYALGIVNSEYLTTRRKACCAVITMSEKENMFAAIDWGLYVTTMEQIQRYAGRTLKCCLYRICDNGFAIVSTSRSAAEKTAVALVDYASNNCTDGISFAYELVSVGDYHDNDAIMSRIADICMTAVNKMAIYDYLTGVYNRNCFEKDLLQFQEEKKNVYYIIIDLNNLKETNDIMGHSTGDALIQSAARLLKNTVGKDGKVYRQGGDEFAVFYLKDDIDDFLGRLDRTRNDLNKSRMIPLSYALGYSRLFDEDGIKSADRMMYQNKREMKSKKTV